MVIYIINGAPIDRTPRVARGRDNILQRHILHRQNRGSVGRKIYITIDRPPQIQVHIAPRPTRRDLVQGLRLHRNDPARRWNVHTPDRSAGDAAAPGAQLYLQGRIDGRIGGLHRQDPPAPEATSPPLRVFDGYVDDAQIAPL